MVKWGWPKPPLANWRVTELLPNIFLMFFNIFLK
jgi:hypothetical protein